MEKLVRKAAGRIARRQGLTGEQEAVVAYGLLAFTQMLVILVLAALFGLLTGTLASCLTVCLGVGALRKFTGGALRVRMGAALPSACSLWRCGTAFRISAGSFSPPAALCGVSLAAVFSGVSFGLETGAGRVGEEADPFGGQDSSAPPRRVGSAHGLSAVYYRTDCRFRAGDSAAPSFPSDCQRLGAGRCFGSRLLLPEPYVGCFTTPDGEEQPDAGGEHSSCLFADIRF